MIQPFLGAQVAYNYRDPIHENHQDQFGLKLRRFDWTSASSRLGLHASVCNIVDFFDGSLDLAWDQMYTSSKNSTKGQFYDFGESFCVCGNKIDKTSIDYALTISKNVANCVNGYVQFEGQWSQHALTNGFILGVDGSF
ncbi:MAG: autotransporter outer membrane beta-barrel domain-containing protein [Chlamydiae bacterium]|nr:autotransporter outer membrane beta-barrel domain-containing protein [Chlamydiota bacterium]